MGRECENNGCDWYLHDVFDVVETSLWLLQLRTVNIPQASCSLDPATYWLCKIWIIRVLVCYLIKWKFVVCFSIFFPIFFLCVFPLSFVLSKKAKGAGWFLLIPLRVYSCSFFPLWTVCFKLFILWSFTHTWQYFEEWGKYSLRKLFSVKCTRKWCVT